MTNGEGAKLQTTADGRRSGGFIWKHAGSETGEQIVGQAFEPAGSRSFPAPSSYFYF